jgi:hypothetical protein
MVDSLTEPMSDEEGDELLAEMGFIERDEPQSAVRRMGEFERDLNSFKRFLRNA